MGSSLPPAPLNSIRALATREPSRSMSAASTNALSMPGRRQSTHKSIVPSFAKRCSLSIGLSSMWRAPITASRRHHRQCVQRVQRSIDGSAVDAVVGVVLTGSTRLAM